MDTNCWNIREMISTEVVATCSDASLEIREYYERGVVDSVMLLIDSLLTPEKIFYTTIFGNPSLGDRIDQEEADTHCKAYLAELFRMFVRSDPEFDGVFRRVTDLDARYLRNFILPKIEGTALFYQLSTMLRFRDEVRSYASYEEALHFLKQKYNHDLIPYQPEDDGVTHINVYSKGKTELGRLLSNFAHTPFEHYKHGHFSSIEAYWYWLSTGMCHDELRGLHGFDAKRVGTALRSAEGEITCVEIKNFDAMIKQAILQKIEQTPKLRDLLHYSDLPLTHYYVWGAGEKYKITYPVKYAWIHEYMEIVRDWLNGRAHKVLISGSRQIKDYEYIRKSHEEADIKTVEFVSGMARGVDQACVQLAGELGLPLREFSADWETHKLSAGYIRNAEMAKYATFAEVHWDGESKGTKHMLDLLELEKVPYKLFRHGFQNK